MLTFALAVFLLIITPGPGVLSLAGVVAAYGWRQGFWALQLQSWQTQLFERCC
jgi:threonine/homoserine/homoserine lactone efflux protein